MMLSPYFKGVERTRFSCSALDQTSGVRIVPTYRDCYGLEVTLSAGFRSQYRRVSKPEGRVRRRCTRGRGHSGRRSPDRCDRV